jgi:hypothetical protein
MYPEPWETSNIYHLSGIPRIPNSYMCAKFSFMYSYVQVIAPQGIFKPQPTLGVISVYAHFPLNASKAPTTISHNYGLTLCQVLKHSAFSVLFMSSSVRFVLPLVMPQHGIIQLYHFLSACLALPTFSGNTCSFLNFYIILNKK